MYTYEYIYSYLSPIMQIGEVQIKMDVGKRLEFSFQKDFYT